MRRKEKSCFERVAKYVGILTAHAGSVTPCPETEKAITARMRNGVFAMMDLGK